jgi:hypothetical protein
LLKPDIVIIDKKKKSVAILELTCPAEHRIPAANNLKMEKYAHFETDHPDKNVSVTPFEIGSHTGYVTRENKARLAKLHKYCKKSIKMKNFVRNISAITVMGSYFIFNCRSQDLWPDMALISPPIGDHRYSISTHSYRKKPVWSGLQEGLIFFITLSMRRGRLLYYVVKYLFSSSTNKVDNIFVGGPRTGGWLDERKIRLTQPSSSA